MAAGGWCVFDVYGTLLDVDAAVRRCDPDGTLPRELSALWRAKQLEYTWTLQAMGAYRDFWSLTGEALDFAIAATGTADAPREELLEAYLRLDAFPEVAGVLASLRAGGVRLAVLSNGTADMLASALDAGRLRVLLDEVISVDEIRIYKPDPRVYRHGAERLGADCSELTFVSSNAWDVAGASRAGMRTVWINRTGRPPEYGLPEGSVELAGLRGL
jgi:2-haloacid dehalogenase